MRMKMGLMIERKIEDKYMCVSSLETYVLCKDENLFLKLFYICRLILRFGFSLR